MRILLYGMQSSGASLVAFFLGQLPGSLVVVDVWNQELVPPLRDVDAEFVIAKAVVTGGYGFEDHAAVFEPNRSILVVRHPAQNYVALSRKYYANESGELDAKLVRLERTFRKRARFDLVLLYEDFVARREHTVTCFQRLGIPATAEHYAFPRSREEITDFNFRCSAWCRENFQSKWGFGNIQGRHLQPNVVYKHVPRAIARRVRQLAPEVSAYCDAHYRTHVPRWTRYTSGWWHDVVVPKSRGAVSRLRRLTARPA